jgi:UDP-N-acetylglucosamine pyrophosphorylase
MTEQLLKENNFFGMDEEQVTIIKQNKVPLTANPKP